MVEEDLEKEIKDSIIKQLEYFFGNTWTVEDIKLNDDNTEVLIKIPHTIIEKEPKFELNLEEEYEDEET